MNNINITLFVTLCLYYLTACNTTGNLTTFTPQEADSNQAVIYLYRPTEMANALYAPGININDEFKLYAKTGVNSRLTVKPGNYMFEFQDEKKFSNLTPLTIDLNSGITYFIRIDTSLGIKETSTYEPYSRSFKFTQVEKQIAVKEISTCCVKSKSLSKIKETKTTEDKQQEGFSVDKTQNPFSH